MAGLALVGQAMTHVNTFTYKKESACVSTEGDSLQDQHYVHVDAFDMCARVSLNKVVEHRTICKML